MVATVKARTLRLVIPAVLRKGDIAHVTAKSLQVGERIGLAPWKDATTGKDWLIDADGKSGLLSTGLLWLRLRIRRHWRLAAAVQASS